MHAAEKQDRVRAERELAGQSDIIASVDAQLKRAKAANSELHELYRMVAILAPGAGADAGALSSPLFECNALLDHRCALPTQHTPRPPVSARDATLHALPSLAAAAHRSASSLDRREVHAKVERSKVGSLLKRLLWKRPSVVTESPTTMPQLDTDALLGKREANAREQELLTVEAAQAEVAAARRELEGLSTQLAHVLAEHAAQLAAFRDSGVSDIISVPIVVTRNIL